jgi:hypothetical protein
MDARVHRKESDRLVSFREVFDVFTTHCIENYDPGTHVTTDEQLVSLQGRCPFLYVYELKPSEVWNENLDSGRCGQDSLYILNQLV